MRSLDGINICDYISTNDKYEPYNTKFISNNIFSKIYIPLMLASELFQIFTCMKTDEMKIINV